MPLRLLRNLFLTVLLLGLQATAGFAQDETECPKSRAILIASCNNPLAVRLRVLPDQVELKSSHLLTVAGTYSSGDRFGIEGLAIKDGTIVSRRYQNWDGVLVIGAEGLPEIFHATDVVSGGENFNLKDKASRDAFVEKAQANGLTVLQSHLLISGGTLDLKDVEGAPKFKRRLLVTFADGSFAVWETRDAETLYDAASQLFEDLNPIMALNLDMGAYDYCLQGPIDLQIDCGGLLISEDKLTNLLEFSNL